MTYVTAGFPSPEETVDILLGMEAGGAGTPFFHILSRYYHNSETDFNFLLDLIELGLPFTDPIADGPTIQKANTVCVFKSQRAVSKLSSRTPKRF